MEQPSSHKQAFLIGIITLLVGTFIGLYLDSLKTRYNDNVEYFDLKVSSIDNYLKTPSIAKNELEIIWKNEAVENISSLTLEFFNFSKDDFENIPIVIELHPQQNENIKVIAHRIIGEDGREDIVKDVVSSTDDESISYSFTAQLFNRTDTDSPNLVVTLLSSGKLAPVPKVFLNKKGVKIREYESFNSYFLSVFEFVAILFVSILGIGYILNRQQTKKEINTYRFAAEAVEHRIVSESIANKNNAPVAGSLTVRDIIHEIRVYRWKRLDWIDRKLKRKPKREDLHY